MSEGQVKLQILGSGNAFSDGGRFNTCFYVNHPEFSFLIDCGASSIVAIRKAGIDVSSIDAIVLSHLHGDHAGGVPFVEMAGRVARRRKKPLKVIGPSGTASLMNNLLRSFFPEVPKSDADFIEYNAGTPVVIDDLQVYAQPAIHVKETNPHSLKITFRNKVIAFSGDTEWNENLPTLADGADVFICECTSPDKGKDHMSYRQLLAHRNSLRARRMIITHMNDEMLNMKDCVFEKGYDGMEIRL